MSEDALAIVDSISELNLYVIKVPVEELQNLRDSYSLNPNYQYVDKNYVVSANAIPNDSLFNQQSHFSLIDAQLAWDVETGDPDVVIAVLDSGVEATHEDLAGKVLTGCSTLGGFNENSCGTNTNDIDGHGSGVSGTAAAQSNNGTGVAGICWGCQILPVKVLGDTGTGTVVDTIQGILFARNYALNNPTKKVVINMSLGRNCNATGISQDEQEAIDLAWAAGVLLVSSAGNSGTSQLQCPAAAANMIAVSATDNNDGLSDFSSFGNFVDLAAPGGNLSPFQFIYNVEGNTGNGYTGWVGTSFSSPIVAGLAGLIWSANMSLTNAEVDQILRTTADNIGSSFFFGDGRINANAAVLAAGDPTPTPPPPTPTPPPVADPVLLGLNPNVAGQSNSLTVTGAPPGSTVFFKYSLSTGTSIISGGTCNGQSLGLNNAIMLRSVVTDGSGTAAYNVNVPAGFSGRTVHLQAYAETGSTCTISNRVTQTIQ
ncbi:MAG: S8 family serine peptidase [Thermodesulfobacteriota bacterium]